MKKYLLLPVLCLLSIASAQADSSYYCNGNTKRSDTSWYYPNGNTAQSGTSAYYSNGNTFTSGQSMYYRNGNTLKSGESHYYSNGNTLKSGSSFYYQNGNTLKSGSTCYYQNGNSMGGCPREFNLDLGLETTQIEVNIDLEKGEFKSYTHRTTANERPVTIKLGGDGLVYDIAYACASDPADGEVRQVMTLYNALDGQKKAKVREQVCGP